MYTRVLKPSIHSNIVSCMLAVSSHELCIVGLNVRRLCAAHVIHASRLVVGRSALQCRAESSRRREVVWSKHITHGKQLPGKFWARGTRSQAAERSSLACKKCLDV